MHKKNMDGTGRLKLEEKIPFRPTRGKIRYVCRDLCLAIKIVFNYFDSCFGIEGHFQTLDRLRHNIN